MKYLQLSLRSEVFKGKEKEQTVLIEDTQTSWGYLRNIIIIGYRSGNTSCYKNP